MTTPPAPATTATPAPRRDPRRWRVGIAWILTLVVFVATLPTVVDGNWEEARWNLGLHAFVVAWLLVATAATRTTSLLETLRFWFVGYFTVTALVLILGEPALRVLDDDSQVRLGLVVPVMEELLKLTPLVLWVVLAARRGVTPSVSDLLVLGFAVGAGFAFQEDLARARVASDGWDANVLATLFPTFLRDAFFAAGHAGWTAVTAAGLGLFVVHRGKVWAWIPLVLTFALVVADHASANLLTVEEGGWLRDLLLDGRLVGWMVLAAVVVAIANDVYVLRWAAARDRRFPPCPVTRQLAAWAGPGSVSDRAGPAHRRGRYRRYRAAVFCDLYRLRSVGATAGDRRQQIRYLQALAARAD